MIVIDKLLGSGISFVLGKIATAVDAELNDDERLREDLLGAQLKLELGEITEDEYDAVERSVMDALRARRQAEEEESGRPQGAFEAARVRVESIEADVGEARAAPSPKPKRRKRKR